MMSSYTALEAFESFYLSSPEHVIDAPGRVNLIGEHTDYNDGFVLPATINFATNIAAKARSDRIINVLAVDYHYQHNSFSLDAIAFSKQQMWVNYIRGTVAELLKIYPDIQGADLAISGNVPQGAGLSSSASFEIAILKTLVVLNQLPLDGVKAALIAQRAENNFVGCRCGIMDQLIASLGKQDHAMLLDCRSLTFEYATIPNDIVLLIINSNQQRGLVESEYNTRRIQCELSAKHFAKPALRDVSLAELECEAANLEPLIYKRAKHIITENDRTIRAFNALRSKDMRAMSQLMRESHLSMQYDFQITTPAIDYLVDIVADVLGDSGGVRMTGGGFGGCVIALTPTHLIDQVKSTVTQLYQAKTGFKADIYVCDAMDGAFLNR